MVAVQILFALGLVLYLVFLERYRREEEIEYFEEGQWYQLLSIGDRVLLSDDDDKPRGHAYVIGVDMGSEADFSVDRKSVV